MADRLPPLTALRAFDAAARHMSFAAAAAELNVTPAALSFQIKSLEEHLGQPLFRRLTRAVELTEAGRALAPGTADGFAALARAWRAARRVGDTTSLTVTAGPAFTAKWLAPRLFGFARAHPEVQLRLAAGLSIMDFDRDEVDVALRFGYSTGDAQDLYETCLIREWMTPMATPELAAQIGSPADLAGMTLLHQDDTQFLDPPGNWAAWFRAAGMAAPEEAGPRFSQADHALDAALGGAGVVLGRISLAQDDIRAGRLVMPFDLSLTTEAHYRFICPKGAETRPHIAAFEAWLHSELEQITDLDTGRCFVAAADIAP